MKTSNDIIKEMNRPKTFWEKFSLWLWNDFMPLLAGFFWRALKFMFWGTLVILAITNWQEIVTWLDSLFDDFGSVMSSPVLTNVLLLFILMDLSKK